MKTIQVACAVLYRDEQVLITRRPPKVHLQDFWEFPGGKVRTWQGETPEQALHREIAEELGVQIEILRKLDTIHYSYPEHDGKALVLDFFLCRLAQGEPKPLVATQMCWVPFVQLGDYKFPPADEEFLKKLPALVSEITS